MARRSARTRRQVPGRPRPVPRRRQAVHGFGPRDGAGDRRLQERQQVHALPRRRRRRRLGRRQRHRRRRRPHWKFMSGSFGTNAIGSLLVDPADPTGNTVYAGTGEPNASADSEAGLGIYKSTDGGDTWSLVPGSDVFRRPRSRRRSRSTRTGNLLVGLDERDSRRQLRVERRRDRLQHADARLRAARPRPVPADGRDVHADLHGVVARAAHPRRAASTRSPRSEQLERRSTVASFQRGRVALARQRRDVDADQDGAEPDAEHRPRASSRSTAPGRQDADVRRDRQRGATRRQPASTAPTTRPARRSSPT